MPAYDTSINPPAPVANVTLRNPANGAIVADVPMLLDSGADVTLIPELAISELAAGVEVGQDYELEGFDGTRSLAAAAQLHMVFLARTFKGRFLVTPQAQGVLGRNVLNHVSLLLDGPRLTWSESPGHPRGA